MPVVPPRSLSSPPLLLYYRPHHHVTAHNTITSRITATHHRRLFFFSLRSLSPLPFLFLPVSLVVPTGTRSRVLAASYPAGTSTYMVQKTSCAVGSPDELQGAELSRSCSGANRGCRRRVLAVWQGLPLIVRLVSIHPPSFFRSSSTYLQVVVTRIPSLTRKVSAPTAALYR
jgi:hypothetical protein